MDDTQEAAAGEALKSVPAVGANAWLWLTNHNLNWWVALATLIYIALQAYVLVRDKILRRGKQDGEKKRHVR